MKSNTLLITTDTIVLLECINVLCFNIIIFCTFIVITPYEVMFGRKAVLPVDFNSQQSYDPDEAVRVFNEAPLPDSVAVEAYRSEMNAMVKANIAKAEAKQKVHWC